MKRFHTLNWIVLAGCSACLSIATAQTEWRSIGSASSGTTYTSGSTSGGTTYTSGGTTGGSYTTGGMSAGSGTTYTGGGTSYTGGTTGGTTVGSSTTGSSGWQPVGGYYSSGTSGSYTSGMQSVPHSHSADGTYTTSGGLHSGGTYATGVDTTGGYTTYSTSTYEAGTPTAYGSIDGSMIGSGRYDSITTVPYTTGYVEGASEWRPLVTNWQATESSVQTMSVPAPAASVAYQAPAPAAVPAGDYITQGEAAILLLHRMGLTSCLSPNYTEMDAIREWQRRGVQPFGAWDANRNLYEGDFAKILVEAMGWSHLLPGGTANAQAESYIRVLEANGIPVNCFGDTIRGAHKAGHSYSSSKMREDTTTDPLRRRLAFGEVDEEVAGTDMNCLVPVGFIPATPQITATPEPAATVTASQEPAPQQQAEQPVAATEVRHVIRTVVRTRTIVVVNDVTPN